MTPDAAQTRVGLVLADRWSVDKVLAIGGTAVVYQGRDKDGTTVALKILHPAFACEPTICERFLREGYLANQVGHPGVLSVIGDGATQDGRVYLVLELLHGGSLDDILQRSGAPLEAVYALAVAEQVLDMLQAAHAKAIIHRDLKPGNIFLTRLGRVKVLDFGLAMLADGSAVSALTGLGMVMGTPQFMSPEQARAQRKKIDARSDLFSLGAVMFRALAGRFVHNAKTVQERLFAAMKDPAVPLASVDPGIDPRVAGIVDKALAFKPDARWQDARDMRAEVMALLVDLARGREDLARVPPDELSTVLVQDAVYRWARD